jgi:hypothetical protein
MSDQLLWQIELTQLRQLMRNEQAAHDRIRDRVLRLQEWYYDGIIDGNINWERWACDRFAYNPAWLRFMSQQHPLTFNKVERQRQQEHDKLIDHQRQHDARRADLGWRAYEKEWTAVQKAGVNLPFGDQVDAIAAKAKPKKKPAAPQLFLVIPPAEIAKPLLEACGQIEHKSRTELGAQYAAMRELAQTNQLGKNPQTGRPWSWAKWAEQYIRRTRQDITKCIAVYEASMLNDASCVISQDANVYSLRRVEN